MSLAKASTASGGLLKFLWQKQKKQSVRSVEISDKKANVMMMMMSWSLTTHQPLEVC